MTAEQSSLPADGDIRLQELDGLRGWASLSVMLFHVFWETFGQVVPGFRNPGVALFANGAMAVAIFFVLSGEALSVSYWRSGRRQSFPRQLVKRYVRLTLPILFSCLLVFVLLRTGLSYSKQAAVLVGREDWLGTFLSFVPDTLRLLRYVFVDVYLHHTTEGSFNPFLWTMRAEMLGSLLVFALLAVDRFVKPKVPLLLVGIVLSLYAKSYMACFLGGLLYGRLHAQGTFGRLRALRWMPAMSAVGMALILAFTAHKQMVDHSGARPLAVAALAFVFLVHCNGVATAFLRNRLSGFLGTVSFPLYLVHFSVIISLTSGVIVYAAAHGGLTVAWVWGIAVASVTASIFLSVIFLPAEKLTHRVSRWVSNRLACRRPAGMATARSGEVS